MHKILFLLFLAVTANAQDFSKFKPTLLQAVGSFQYNNASYYSYARYTENYEDSVITKPLAGKSIVAFVSQANKGLLEANKDSVVNRLLLHSYISVSNYTTQWEAIKYKTVLAKDTSAYQVLVVKIDKQRIQEDNESEIGQMLKNVMKLKSDVYSQFEYEKPTSEYTDLVPIAKQVKDTDGTLNIFKLSLYLKTKPPALAKYCDY